MRIRNRKAARFEIGRLSCLVSAFLGEAVGIAILALCAQPFDFDLSRA